MRKRKKQQTMLFISASAKTSPSQSMLQTSLSNTQEIRIAAEGPLFFSFTINCCWAANCKATRRAARAVLMTLFLTINSASSLSAYESYWPQHIHISRISTVSYILSPVLKQSHVLNYQYSTSILASPKHSRKSAQEGYHWNLNRLFQTFFHIVPHFPTSILRLYTFKTSTTACWIP